MNDENVIAQLLEKIKNIEYRLTALEKEQRIICEDILSGSPTERMRQRLLENSQKRKEELIKKIENEIRFEI
ncbi:MAG: hypothetical protein ACQXXF_06565 [Thermoplasmatota archaeon]|jgi:chaperonin cofactor prefoldin